MSQQFSVSCSSRRQILRSECFASQQCFYCQVSSCCLQQSLVSRFTVFILFYSNLLDFTNLRTSDKSSISPINRLQTSFVLWQYWCYFQIAYTWEVLKMVGYHSSRTFLLWPEWVNEFIHSLIPAISIAPLQVLYYSKALPTTARILYRSFTLKGTDNCR